MTLILRNMGSTVCTFEIRIAPPVSGAAPLTASSLAVRNNDTNKSSYLEISSSVMYSIGYGPWPAVWVSGKAGWFEINPAPEYEAMYELVCEGITLYYSLMVAYEDRLRKLAKAKRAKAMQTKIHDLLFKVRTPHVHCRLETGSPDIEKYAVSVGDGVTLSEAKERCQKHAPFLLAHFSKELAFNWNATSFIKWLSTENEVRASICKQTMT